MNSGNLIFNICMSKAHCALPRDFKLKVNVGPTPAQKEPPRAEATPNPTVYPACRQGPRDPMGAQEGGDSHAGLGPTPPQDRMVVRVDSRIRPGRLGCPGLGAHPRQSAQYWGQPCSGKHGTKPGATMLGSTGPERWWAPPWVQRLWQRLHPQLSPRPQEKEKMEKHEPLTSCRGGDLSPTRR